MIMLSKCPDELSENDELKGDELCGYDCTLKFVKATLLLKMRHEFITKRVSSKSNLT